MTQQDIGVIGLAVMGQNLVLNMLDHGYSVAVYNRTAAKTDEFLAEHPNKALVGAHSIQALVAQLQTPRKILLMVKAGAPVDDFIAQCLPFLTPGDLLIDGGNSHFVDTERRATDLEKRGILFIGAGISGGEEGARHGPSMMPGGNPAGWPLVRAIFQAISAQVNKTPCCDWVGPGGAGHYVKMVHNGIEYGDMQLIAEAYALLSQGAGLNADQIGEIFSEWNQGELASYLVEITAQILAFKENGAPLVDQILDTAGQKGTGKWTVNDALELGVPLTLIGEAVFARALSSMKEERTQAAFLFASPQAQPVHNVRETIEAIKSALYASKIISYTQGFLLMRRASEEHRWNLNFGAIAQLWRGGCIIRSQFLQNISDAYAASADLKSLLFAPFFRDALLAHEQGWRDAIALGIRSGIPLPATGAALAFYDGYRSNRLPANLIQAQRDFFGAHTYERVDAARGQFFHTNWTGEGGHVHSGSYNA